MTVPMSVSDIMETGNWETDTAHGREVASARIAEARRDGSPCGINAVIRSIAESRRYGGVEVGFVFALAAEIIRPSL